MREREDSAVVFDLTWAYVEAFFDPDRDTILNPADARCPAWTIFNDCTSYSDFTAAAAALIPFDGGGGDPFRVLAAPTLFIEMCMKLMDEGLTSNQALAENLMTSDLKLVHEHLANTIADPITAPGAGACYIGRRPRMVDSSTSASGSLDGESGRLFMRLQPAA